MEVDNEPHKQSPEILQGDHRCLCFATMLPATTRQFQMHFVLLFNRINFSCKVLLTSAATGARLYDWHFMTFSSV